MSAASISRPGIGLLEVGGLSVGNAAPEQNIEGFFHDFKHLIRTVESSPFDRVQGRNVFKRLDWKSCYAYVRHASREYENR